MSVTVKVNELNNILKAIEELKTKKLTLTESRIVIAYIKDVESIIKKIALEFQNSASIYNKNIEEAAGDQDKIAEINQIHSQIVKGLDSQDVELPTIDYTSINTINLSIASWMSLDMLIKGM